MKLNLKGFSQLIEDMGAALQGATSNLIDVSVGSVVRALFEANASVALWMQWLLLQVLQTTRAATASGSDLDSWMLDFGQTRLAAAPASGVVTFSRFASTLPATIPLGAGVKTFDGSLTFLVAEDTSLSVWQPALAVYTIPAGVAAIDLPVVCRTPGLTGNVLAGAINMIASSLPGVDQVSNALAFSNGTDVESDQSFRNRFQSFLASRSRGTILAARNAISNVRQGLNVEIAENVDPSGIPQLGSFIVIVDDGTGVPSETLLSEVANSIEAIRPIGTMFTVLRPQIFSANVTLRVEYSDPVSPIDHAAVTQQISNYINSIPIGRSASVTRIAEHIYKTEPGIMNVADIRLNGGLVDLTPPRFAVIKAGQVTVTTSGG